MNQLSNVFANVFGTMTRRIITVGVLALAAVVIVGLPATTHADTLNRQLQLGMSGADVSALQTFLAMDPAVYPQGLVTGYFGFLTKSAVANFQSKNGISAVGRVGPATLPVLNFQIAAGTVSTSLDAPIISNVNISTSRNNANVNWNTNEFAKGVVYYSTSPLVTYEHPNSADVSGNTAMTDAAFRTNQNVALSNLLGGTTYYYLVYTTDQDGNVSVTWPATFVTSY